MMARLHVIFLILFVSIATATKTRRRDIKPQFNSRMHPPYYAAENDVYSEGSWISYSPPPTTSHSPPIPSTPSTSTTAASFTTITPTTQSATSSETTTPSSVDPSSQCTREYSCLNCTAARVCAPTLDGQSLYEIKRFTCSPSMPYCNYTSGSCSYSPDPECSDTPSVVVSSNFTCMRDGYFPDPHECSLYYHCQNEVPYQYSCVYPTPYYNPYYQYCVSNNWYCEDMVTQCQYEYSGTKISFWESKNFVYCENGTVIAVDRCIGAYIFDYTSQVCIPTCPHEGLFPKDDDCANYYKCSPKSHELDSGLFMTDKTCPDGQGFSEAEYSCVDRSLAPNCKVPYADLFNKK